MNTVQIILGHLQEPKTNNMKTQQQTTRANAQDLLLDAKVAINTLVELGPDYGVWQNAQSSFKILKKVKKELQYIG